MDQIFVLIILFAAVVLHEYAHGWMAYKLGDPTAKLAGRLTLNPIKHIDPVGTIILPGILMALRFMGFHTFIFGWAKPVPVNFLQLKNPRRDMMLVAAAGPAINLIIAFVLSRFVSSQLTLAQSDILAAGIFVNLLLAVFNLIPIPPLDGSRILTGILPRDLAMQYVKLERYGILIVVALLYFGLFEKAVLPVVQHLGRILGVNLS